MVGDIQHHVAALIIDHRYVLVPLLERCLVHAQHPRRLPTPASQTAGHRPAPNARHLVPTQSQLASHHLHACLLEPLDDLSLHQSREARFLVGPWHPQLTNPVLRAPHTRNLGMHPRLVLHRVEMPPTPPTSVVPRRRSAALGTPRWPHVLDVDLHRTPANPRTPEAIRLVQTQNHLAHSPGALDSQKPLEGRGALHALSLRLATAPTACPYAAPTVNCGCGRLSRPSPDLRPALASCPRPHRRRRLRNLAVSRNTADRVPQDLGKPADRFPTATAAAATN